MTSVLRKSTFTIGLMGLFALALATPAQAGSVNKSVRIGDGETAGEASSVNGSIPSVNKPSSMARSARSTARFALMTMPRLRMSRP